MNRKEEILNVTLELAAEKGLKNVSMAQIAERTGIRKPSIYNHFSSREEIISAMYRYFRDSAKAKRSLTETDYGVFVHSLTAEQALNRAVHNYISITRDEKMFLFYKVIYSERAVDPVAARIIAEETATMIAAAKNLFYALNVHGKLFTSDIDTAAFSFAMTIHAIIDYHLDCDFSGTPIAENHIEKYIKWFCKELGGDNSEKGVD